MEKLEKFGRLPKLQKPMWLLHPLGGERVREPSGREEVGGLLLAEVGRILDEKDACSGCARGAGPFRVCVVPPGLKGCSFFRGSCASCVWRHKAATC